MEVKRKRVRITKADLEKLEAMEKRCLRERRRDRSSYTRESTALRETTSLSLKSTWLAVLEYGEKFAIPLSGKYKPISLLNTKGTKNSGLKISRSQSKGNLHKNMFRDLVSS